LQDVLTLFDPRRAQDLVRFFQTFGLLNLYKEAGRSLMVSAAYYLTIADVRNAGVALNRDAATALVICYQTSMSVVLRLEISNYDDPRFALATCLLQGVLEVVLRLTIHERDAWAKRVSTRVCGATRKLRAATLIVSAVAPRSEGHSTSALAKSDTTVHRSVTTERAAAAHERADVVNLFRARMLLVDMWGEYAGIYISAVVLFLGQSMPLYYSFRPYRKYPELFDGCTISGDIAYATVVQVVVEIITDTTCLVFEARRGLAPLTVWREFPKAALTPLIIFALMLSTFSGQVRSFYSESMEQCNHRDLCWCVGNGLLPGGVRESYCVLLFPNSSGIPAPKP
jgi:hypothetical protein